MTVFGLVLKLSELLLLEGLPWFGNPPSGDYATGLTTTVKEGLLLGLGLGIALAVYAGLLHRHTYKPVLFRFALVIVGMTVSLLLVQPPFHLSYLLDFIDSPSDLLDLARFDPWIALFIMLSFAKHVAIGMMSLYAAGRYLGDASASFLNSREQTLA